MNNIVRTPGMACRNCVRRGCLGTATIGTNCIMAHIIIFFTEFAESGSVYDYVHKEQKQPPLSQMLLWAAQVAEGIMTGQSHATDATAGTQTYGLCCRGNFTSVQQSS